LYVCISKIKSFGKIQLISPSVEYN